MLLSMPLLSGGFSQIVTSTLTAACRPEAIPFMCTKTGQDAGWVSSMVSHRSCLSVCIPFSCLYACVLSSLPVCMCPNSAAHLQGSNSLG